MIGTSNKIITYLLEQSKDKKFQIEEYKEKRGLKANNYYWTLINELANKLNISKEELHFLMLQSYGQSEMVSVVEGIDVQPYFKYYCKAGESILNGKKFIHYKIYKGSSEMDSKEMSVLINGLVQECQQQDIETKSKEEIQSLINNWR